MKDIVILKSLTSGTVGIYKPEIQLNVTFPRKNARVRITKEKLEDAISYPGVLYLFEKGIIGIEEGADLGELLSFYTGEVKVPFELTEKVMKKLLTTANEEELRSALKEMSKEQKDELVRFAITNDVVGMQAADIIKEECGQDLIKIRTLKKQAEEGDKPKTAK